MIIYINGCR